MKEAAAMTEQDKEEPILSELYNSHFPTLPLFTHFAWSVRAGPLHQTIKTQVQNKADRKGSYEHIKIYPTYMRRICCQVIDPETTEQS